MDRVIKKHKSIKEFVLKLLKISIPIMIANLFTNVASLIDTMMVGKIDQINFSGVFVATQVIFVINLAIFGSVEGSSIYFSQFLGKKDSKHLRNSFAFKIIATLIVGTISTLIVLIFGRPLAKLFTKNPQEIEVAVKYMNILSISIIPFGINVAISTSLREDHHTFIPMMITFFGVIINILVNYIFIFGSWGMPRLEGIGAAIGTVAERGFETIASICALVFMKCDFSKDIFKSFKIEKPLLKNMTLKSIPLLFNELLWSLGQTGLVYVFTQKTELATSVLPISTTIFNLVLVVTMGLGNGVSILTGNIIGDNDMEEAQHKGIVSIITTAIITSILGVILFFTAPFIVTFYSEVSQVARDTACYFLKFDSIYIVITSLNCIFFFLMRAGGRTFIVFLFDSAFSWIISIPGAFFFLKVFPGLTFEQLFILTYLLDLIKTIIGFILIISKKWHKNIVNQYSEQN